MRLIVEGFTQGLVDSNVVTRMGLAKPGEGLSQDEIRLSQCPATDINAVEFFPKLTFSKIYGRENLQSSPWQSSAIIRLYNWRSEAGLEKALVFSALSGAASASIAEISKASGVLVFNNIEVSGDSLTGWSPSCSGDMIDVCSYGGSAIMTYGGTNMPLAVYVGTSPIVPLLGTNAPSGAKTVAAWGSYLFAGNVMVGSVRRNSRVQWCSPLNPGNWPTYSFLDLDAEDSDGITGMWLLRDILVVFKKYKTFIVKYVGGVLEFDWERIDAGVGCVGANAIAEIDNVLYFISSDGFYAFDGTKPPYAIDTNVEGLVKNRNADLESQFEVDYYDNSELFFTVANGSSIRKNRVYIYDTSIHNWTKWDVEVAGIGSLMYGASERYIDFPLPYYQYGMRIGDAKGSKDPIFTFGSYDGYLYKYGNSLNDLDNAIDAYWISPWIDFGYPDRNKRILRVYIYVDGTDTPHTVAFEGFTDWDDVTTKITETFTTQAIGKTIAEKRLDFTLPVRAFKFKIGVEELNANVTVHKVIIDFLVKGRTITS